MSVREGVNVTRARGVLAQQPTRGLGVEIGISVLCRLDHILHNMSERAVNEVQERKK